jgi:hypothetical protein
MNAELLAERKVLIVSGFGWHDVILRPLVSRLSTWLDLDFAPLARVQAGWRPASEPDLVIVCDAGNVRDLRPIFSRSLFLHVGHGLISKNEPQHHYSEPDFICVASDGFIRRLTDRGHVPRRQFFATGLVQSDPLFDNSPQRAGVRVSGCVRSILYAPTWNPTLTSAAMFGDHLVALLRGTDTSMEIVIKPHPHIAVVRPEWIRMWQSMAEREENVLFHDPDADLIQALLGADLLVSDASSAIFHFVALDRPIVLVNNPARYTQTNRFDPEGIEWLWRDVAASTDSVDEVQGLIHSQLSDPNHLRDNRLRRREQLFGDLTDGRSCERVNLVVAQILGKMK